MPKKSSSSSSLGGGGGGTGFGRGTGRGMKDFGGPDEGLGFSPRGGLPFTPISVHP